MDWKKVDPVTVQESFYKRFRTLDMEDLRILLRDPMYIPCRMVRACDAFGT